MERQSLKDETPPVTVTAPSGAREEIALEPKEPGLSRARFDGEGDGALSLRERRLDRAGQRWPGQSARISRGGVDPGKAAPAGFGYGGTVRRLSTGSFDDIALPRIVELRDANMFGGADWIGVKRGAAGALKGVEATPLGIGLSALLALLGAILFVWTWEGRR